MESEASAIKPRVSVKSVLAFLKKKSNYPVDSVVPLDGGEYSQAFRYRAGEENLILRINSKDYSFRKDAYAYQNFSSPKIPIPETLDIGPFSDSLYYSITRSAESVTLDHLKENQRKIAQAALFEVMSEIHAVKISSNSGYGYWNTEGEARFKTWTDFLIDIFSNETSNWENRVRKGYISEQLLDSCQKVIEKYKSYLPNKHHLVHGDLGGSNVVWDGKKITAVLDWGSSKYGDPVYDAAFKAFWYPDTEYLNIFREHFEEKNYNLNNYTERMLVYQVYVGLKAIDLFIQSGQKQRLKRWSNRLSSLLRSAKL